MKFSLHQILKFGLLAVCCSIGAGPAWSISPPGHVIDNVALATYTQGGKTITVSSNQATFTVLELVDVRVQWNDAGPVVVGSPDANRPLSFKVYNLGNSPHGYRITARPLSGQSMTPTLASTALYIESGLEPGLQTTGSSADKAIANGEVISIDAQVVRTIYALSNIAAGAIQGARGGLSLEAASAIASVAGQAPGTRLSAAGSGGVDLVVGRSSAIATDGGLYSVEGALVKTAKRVASVLDTNGGTKVKSGSVVVYEISLDAQGRGYLSDLTIADALPSELEYVPGSLSLDGVALADTGRVSGNTLAVVLSGRYSPFSTMLQFKAKVR